MPGVFNVLEIYPKADPTGIHDSTPAFQAAFTAAAVAGGTVRIPGGFYMLASGIEVGVLPPSCTLVIEGEGPENTVIFFPNNSGISILYSNWSNCTLWSGFTITAGAANTGTAIKINRISKAVWGNVPCTLFDRVFIRGDDAYSSIKNSWGTCIDITDVGNVVMTNGLLSGQSAVGDPILGFSTEGVGVSLIASDSPDKAPPTTGFNFTNMIFDMGIGVIYGNWVEGLTFAQCNFTGTKYGIYSPVPGNELDQLSVTGSQFNCSGAGIFCNSPIQNVMISSCLFITYTAGAVGVNLQAWSSVAIMGNCFQGYNHNKGIILGSNNNQTASVIGNTFNGYDVALELNSKNVIHLNNYSDCLETVTGGDS